jgi:hypothetical protein
LPIFPSLFFSRAAAAPGVLGAAKAAEKATDLQRVSDGSPHHDSILLNSWVGFGYGYGDGMDSWFMFLVS